MFVLMRIWGKKHLSQVTTFDFILLLFISEAVQNSLVDDDHSVWGGMIVVTTFLIWSTVLNKLSYKYKRLEKFLDGSPKIIVKDGKCDEAVLRREEISIQELHMALREEGVMDIKDVKQATVETNGHISVVQNH
jgi:uncharacterized membrane protein YcaP (DUF421 family)